MPESCQKCDCSQISSIDSEHGEKMPEKKPAWHTAGDEGFKVHPQPLLAHNYKSQCGDEGLKVHPQPALSQK